MYNIIISYNFWWILWNYFSVFSLISMRVTNSLWTLPSVSMHLQMSHVQRSFIFNNAAVSITCVYASVSNCSINSNCKLYCVCVNLQRMQFAAHNQPQLNQWFHRDIDAMCQQLNTAPVFIDADRSIIALLLLLIGMSKF